MRRAWRPGSCSSARSCGCAGAGRAASAGRSGVALPLALAGAALGVVLGFYLVWVRWFRRR